MRLEEIQTPPRFIWLLIGNCGSVNVSNHIHIVKPLTKRRLQNIHPPIPIASYLPFLSHIICQKRKEEKTNQNRPRSSRIRPLTCSKLHCQISGPVCLLNQSSDCLSPCFGESGGTVEQGDTLGSHCVLCERSDVCSNFRCGNRRRHCRRNRSRWLRHARPCLPGPPPPYCL